MRLLAGNLIAALSVMVAVSACTGVTTSGSPPVSPPGRPPVGAAPSSGLVVRTGAGLVRGLDAHSAREFFGIPYAAPPVGQLRWQPPRPAAPWPGIRDATLPGPACAQTGSLAAGVISTSTNEDCLFLNVYTPVQVPGDLPVIVWIYGGGFTGGQASIYDGAPLAATQHVIVVTINYRLGAFGFLALPSLGVGSGDYGLLDQQAALRWVRRNIGAFGGNARDVTIDGESAGAASVCDNMASPGAAGLFQRAIAESGCSLPGTTVAGAEQRGAVLEKALGCADVACLRGKPASAVLAAANDTLGGWSPATGTATLPVQPSTAFLTGKYARVPLLQGTNAAEGRFFVALDYDQAGHPLTAGQYPATIAGLFGAANGPKVAAEYPLSAYPSPDLAYAAAFTDGVFSCPALVTDEVDSATPVYAYEFSDPAPPDDFGLKFTFPLGPAHSTELQYVFGKIPVLDTTPPFTPGQAELSRQIMGYWARFAATGNPNGPGLPYWPPFTSAGRQMENLAPGQTGARTDFAAEHKCAFWGSLTG